MKTIACLLVAILSTVALADQASVTAFQQAYAVELATEFPELSATDTAWGKEVRAIRDGMRERHPEVFTLEDAPALIAEVALNKIIAGAAGAEKQRLQAVLARFQEKKDKIAQEIRARLSASRTYEPAPIPRLPARAVTDADLAAMPGAVGDVARERLLHPPHVGESPQDYYRRRAREKAIEAGTWNGLDEIADAIHELNSTIQDRNRFGPHLPRR